MQKIIHDKPLTSIRFEDSIRKYEKVVRIAIEGDEISMIVDNGTTIEEMEKLAKRILKENYGI